MGVFNVSEKLNLAVRQLIVISASRAPVRGSGSQTCKFSYKSRNSYFFLENRKFSVQHSPKEMLYLFNLKWMNENISLDTALLC